MCLQIIELETLRKAKYPEEFGQNPSKLLVVGILNFLVLKMCIMLMIIIIIIMVIKIIIIIIIMVIMIKNNKMIKIIPK